MKADQIVIPVEANTTYELTATVTYPSRVALLLAERHRRVARAIARSRRCHHLHVAYRRRHR